MAIAWVMGEGENRSEEEAMRKSVFKGCLIFQAEIFLGGLFIYIFFNHDTDV